jgi:hypothetical protein
MKYRSTKLSILTQERLKEVILYSPELGTWTWVGLCGANRRLNGKAAGRVHHGGYLMIGIDRVQYPAHRLAFLYVTGKFPENIVDHRDTDTLNNKWLNLREATYIQNAQNSKGSKNRASPYKGAYVDRRYQKFSSSISVNKKKVWLGYFDTAEAAAAAYAEAARKHHGDFARTT